MRVLNLLRGLGCRLGAGVCEYVGVDLVLHWLLVALGLPILVGLRALFFGLFSCYFLVVCGLVFCVVCDLVLGLF